MIRRSIRIALTSMTLAAGASAGELVVRIENISEQSGHLLLSLSASAAQWDGDEAPERRRMAASGDSLEVSFGDVQPGRYAVQVMHDANDNGKMDSNLLGIPSEGYGFSNNPQVMRRAQFDEAAFDVGAEGDTITIRVREWQGECWATREKATEPA